MIETPNYKPLVAGLLIILLFITSIIWFVLLDRAKSNDTLTVAFLDVGQGDAIYIEAPNGNQVLIDGGVDKTILRRLSRHMSFWDRSINMVIASHPDNDHIGGLPSVLDRFRVDMLLEPGIYSDNGTYDVLLQTSQKNVVSVVRARMGERYDLGSEVYLDVLFPDRDVSGLDPNAGSIIARLTYKETSFLFTGDSPQAIEKYLVSQFGDALEVDVLKLGHHGSKTSSSMEFLGYTSPEFAVISAGKDNSYGHPHAEVIEKLELLDITYVNTADVGTILFESDGKEVLYKE